MSVLSASNALILICLTVILFLRLRKVFKRKLLSLYKDYQALDSECFVLGRKIEQRKEQNLKLEKSASDTVALFDITRQICKTLDEDKLFVLFKEELSRHIASAACKFIKDDKDLPVGGDCLILPLKIDKKPFGYLAVDKIRQEDKDTFFILSQQIILGLKRAMLYRQVQELAITDGLTGVFSRRHFIERFKEEAGRSKAHGMNFSFLMLDIDHFKDYNDRYGHLVGDVILKETARAVKENIRQIDLLGKYGGDEFSLILSEADKTEGTLVAERIRKSIESKQIKAYDEDIKVTISIGLAVFPGDAKNPDQLVEKADQALYQAKAAGRNRVCISGSKILAP